MKPDVDEVPDTEKGFLTPRMASYLNDPKGFEAENDKETVSRVKWGIRKARSDALKEFRYLEQHWKDWEKEQNEGIPEQPAEKHVDKVHVAPLFQSEAQMVSLHMDTIEVLDEMRIALSELILENLFARYDKVSDEFDTMEEFHRWAEENPMVLRPETREDAPDSANPVHSNFLFQYDDVVRLALQTVPREELLSEVEAEIKEMEPWPGIFQEGPTAVLKTMAESIDKSKLQRSKGDTH